MKYIVENWFVIVGLIAVCAAGGYAVYVLSLIHISEPTRH